MNGLCAGGASETRAGGTGERVTGGRDEPTRAPHALQKRAEGRFTPPHVAHSGNLIRGSSSKHRLSRSARHISTAVWKRSAGDFASALIVIAASASGISRSGVTS